MQVAALVLGIIGGLFGLLIGLFGYGVGGIAGAAGASGAGLIQLISMAMPVAGLVGAALAMANPLVAGVLMLLSAVGLLGIFGFNFFTAIPLVLNGLGGAFALAAVNQGEATGPATALTGTAARPSVDMRLIIYIAVGVVTTGLVILLLADWTRTSDPALAASSTGRIIALQRGLYLTPFGYWLYMTNFKWVAMSAPLVLAVPFAVFANRMTMATTIPLVGVLAVFLGMGISVVQTLYLR